jgi:hypothetical protein
MSDKRVFISYSHGDQEVARMIDASLSVAGAQTFLDERDIKIGDPIMDKVSEGIASSTELIYIISNKSINSSWAKKELSIAEMRQIREQGFRILPVLIDEVELPTSLSNIRYSDMRLWRDLNEYRKASLELLATLDLKPYLVTKQQVEWWARNRASLTQPRKLITEFYHATDFAIGFGQWFYDTGGCRWAWKWIADVSLQCVEDLRDQIQAETHPDKRLEVMNDAAIQMIEAFRDPWTGDEAEVRRFRTAAGRIISVLDELETEVFSAVISTVSFT